MAFAAHCHIALDRTPDSSKALLKQLAAISRRQLTEDIGRLNQIELAQVWDGVACVVALIHHAWQVEGLEVGKDLRDRIDTLRTCSSRRARNVIGKYKSMSDGFKYLVTPAQADIALIAALKS